MSIQNYKDHQIHGTLTRLNELVEDEIFGDSDLFTDDTAAFNKSKLIEFTRYLKLMVAGTPANLTSTPALTSINSNLQNVVSEVTNFISNRNVGHLENAVSYIENNVLPHTWGFANIGRNLPKKELAELLNSIDEQSQSFAMRLEAKRADIQSQLEQSAESLESLSEDLKAQQAAFDSLAKEQDNTLANLQSSFDEKEAARQSEFDSRIKHYNENIDQIAHGLQENAETTISQLDSYRDQAARIVQSVGTIGITGNYKNIADSEKNAANLWRWITLAIFASGIGLAIATFVRFYYEPITTQNIWAIAIRLMYALAIAAPALYTARESARHRTNSDRARQSELELASLGPFIELMEDSQKEEIRKSLIPKYFGKSIDPHKIEASIDTAQITEAIKQIKSSAG